jgi:putative phage-type endonuclease
LEPNRPEQSGVGPAFFQDNTRKDKMEQRSPEWFASRLGLITASSVGAILGHSPNATRADVMRRMVREWHGAEPEFTGNIATEYGQNNEAGAIVEFKLETGFDVEPVGFITKEDWAGCSPDGRIGEVDPIGLEVKCPFGLRDAPAPVPFKSLRSQLHYYDQVQFSLWVTGWQEWKFYQWAKNGTMLETYVANPYWQYESLVELQEFHKEYLHEREMPHAAKYLAPRRKEIDTPEAARVMAEYDQICESIENAESRKKELLADMVRMAGEKDAVIAGRNLTKVEKAGAVSYAKAIKELLPDADLEKLRGNPSIYWMVK